MVNALKRGAINIKKSFLIVILFLLTMFFLTGCGKSQVDEDYNQFKQSYLVATEFIDKDNNLEKALKTIDYNQMNIEMEKMKKARDEMSVLLSTDREKGLYSNVSTFYQDVEYIVYASKNFKNLTIEEKRKLLMTAISIKGDRDEMLKGEL